MNYKHTETKELLQQIDEYLTQMNFSKFMEEDPVFYQHEWASSYSLKLTKHIELKVGILHLPENEPMKTVDIFTKAVHPYDMQKDIVKNVPLRTLEDLMYIIENYGKVQKYIKIGAKYHSSSSKASNTASI